jgi:hypothetical protein
MKGAESRVHCVWAWRPDAGASNAAMISSEKPSSLNLSKVHPGAISLQAVIVSEALLARLVSGERNPVPGGMFFLIHIILPPWPSGKPMAWR